jgi:hypothetical protein
MYLYKNLTAVPIHYHDLETSHDPGSCLIVECTVFLAFVKELFVLFYPVGASLDFARSYVVKSFLADVG